MTRITSIKPTRIPHIRTLTVCFEYSDDHRVYQLEAEVEQDGPDSFTCTNITGAEEVSDHLWRCMAEKAEEIAFDRANQLTNRRTGCLCPPVGSGTLAEMIHEETCPIYLSKAEREAWLDQVAKEKREAHRASRGEAHEDARLSAYEQEQRRLLDENTEIYLTLK